MKTPVAYMLDYEKEFIEVLRTAVGALPIGSATLDMWRDDSSPYLYFGIIPRSTDAAAIRGEIASSKSITLVVGEGQREILGNGHLLHGKTIQQELSEICDAVIMGCVHEACSVDQEGKKVRVDTFVTINGRQVNFGWTTISSFFKKTEVEARQYQPYN